MDLTTRFAETSIFDTLHHARVLTRVLPSLVPRDGLALHLQSA